MNRTSLETVGTVSLSHVFMSTPMRFKFIWIAEMEIYILYVEIVLKLVVEKHALEGMDSNPL